ncbi:MAG: chromate transporter [Treponemataceae bacterium]|nr:chromate transporter [Spirochaetales bacterium]MDY6030525.1 chromate transporter [Treponemataceae bacterium]
MTLIKLCATFFYIGLFTIGGGMVAITLMQQELVDKGLIDAEKFFNMVAISESTPGPIGINMATYVGIEFYGVLGGILTTFFTVLPSLIVIIIIARFIQKLDTNPYVKSAFSTVKPVVAGLIAVATWNVVKIAILPENFSISSFAEILPQLLFFVIGILLLSIKKMHPIAVVLLGAFFGIVFL